MAESLLVDALSAVMADVGAVRKDDRNNHHNFNFRGIDAVVNAVSPALREHKIIVTPTLIDVKVSPTKTSGGKDTNHALVQVRYTFHGHGESLAVEVPGEAMDNGDKAVAKAMSVAFRTALLQALALPTDEPDPDSHTYEVEKEPELPAESDPEWVEAAAGAIQEATNLQEITAAVEEIRDGVKSGKCSTADRNRLLKSYQDRKQELA